MPERRLRGISHCDLERLSRGEITKNCAWRCRPQGTPSWEQAPSNGSSVRRPQLPVARWGRHSNTQKFKGIAGTTPRRQFDNSGHVAALMRGLHGSAVPGPRAEAGPGSGGLLGRNSEMKILTDAPGLARDIYEAWAMAVMFVCKTLCAVHGWP